MSGCRARRSGEGCSRSGLGQRVPVANAEAAAMLVTPITVPHPQRTVPLRERGIIEPHGSGIEKANSAPTV